MLKEKPLSRAMRLMFIGSMAMSLQLAYAQESTDAVQKVEVTGSRIPILVTEGSSPVTTISAKDIKIDGVRSVEDLLNNLPQVFADQGGSLSNGATGTATVDLRGLGSQRTLVLVNGKRLPLGSPVSGASAADLNEIPAALVQRVEILTGGASAVYGADAVAGVVNFILKDNFQGVQMEANTSGHNHSQHNSVASVVSAKGDELPGNKGYDGKVNDVSLLMGGNFDNDKGNATLFFTFKKEDAVLQSSRDFSSCALGSNANGFTCSGSSTAATGRIMNNVTGQSFTNGPNGAVLPYSSAANAYNFGPLNYYQRPSESYGFNAQLHYDINENVRLYEEFNFHNYSTTAQIAPGGVFFGNQQTLSFNNPLLSPAWLSALGLSAANPTVAVTLGRRDIEGGPRTDSITDSSFREVMGVKGEVKNWTYDVFGEIARVNHQETQGGYFSTNKLANALVAVPGTGGAAACGGTDPNCVPYNMFTTGGVTQAALNYLLTQGLITGNTQQSIVGANVGSDLAAYGIKLPTAKEGVGISFGVEHRTESLTFTPDQEIASGDLSGGAGQQPAINAEYAVKEIFGEVRVPLVSNVPLVKSLNATGSYRNSNYSTGNKTNTFGLGLDWGVNDQLRMRGSFQRAERAPNIYELANPQAVTLNGPNNDPCSGATPTATAAACAHSGVTAGQYGLIANNSANQYQSLGGGNPDVKPEQANTVTLGIVLDPIKNLTVTLDAFSIKIKDTISTVDPTVALTQCLATGSATFCNLIHRDSLGSLWLLPTGYVSGTTTNIGSLSTTGLDLGTSYFTKVGDWGTLNFTLNGTYLKSLETENVPGLGKYDCAGYFGATCGTPNAKWRHKLRTVWTTPSKAEIAVTWRHFNAVSNDALNPSPLLAGSVNPIEATLAARNYFDLHAAYPLTKSISVSGGINNLFDKDPPIVSTNATAAAGSANGNTYPQVYDTLGRLLYLNVTAKF